MTIEGNGDLSVTAGSGGDGIQVLGSSAFTASGSNLTLSIQDNASNAFNVGGSSSVNLFRAVVNCSERPQDPPVGPTCPTP